jgi:DNA-binding NtrC family response regulator
MADMAFCRMNMRLVVTDIRMPGHNWFEIAREGRKLKANIPIVFMTSFEIVPSEFEQIFPSLTGINLLKKPFHLQTMMELVRSIEQTF